MVSKEVMAVEALFRAANYLCASQIYLKDNFFLDRELRGDDIKSVLLGHWGTCPGINFVYAHLNNLIVKKNCDMMFILGPGHGFPALQANLFIEGTLSEFYKKVPYTSKGIAEMSRKFSWPYGFPSHSNPGAPGVILEGGELGYSLSTAYGAVLDNPDLIVACLIGDGEAETGALATSWHANKLVSPKNNGAVLPILHLNGYKISGPTFMGRMSDSELMHLFTGYGYAPIIVDGTGRGDVHLKMISVLEKAYSVIRKVQKQARGAKGVVSPRMPMIILRTHKGWTGISELDGKDIEGNCLSHQVVAKDCKTNPEHLALIEDWLRSYNFSELFDLKSGFSQKIRSIIPRKNKRMGMSPYASAEKYKPLKLPDANDFAEEVPVPGTIGSSSMRRIGAYLNEVFKLNKSAANFRLMSPDETYSNKLDEVFDTTTRAFTWPLKPHDLDISDDGRVMEMLSEHTLQGLCQGYLLTGRHCAFASYAAFIEIVSSMTDQYQKFLRVSREFPWRRDVASLNYILTSSGWRQQHNGFSHQNPSFISGILEKPGCSSKVYFPADGSSALCVIEACLQSKNSINLIVVGKTVEPRWLTVAEARKNMDAGIAIWEFASKVNPDVVFVGVGDYMTKECLAAIDILRADVPKLKSRFVNIVELTSIGIGRHDCLIPPRIEKFVTKDKPVIVNYHGYVTDFHSLIAHRNDSDRFVVHGYEERGSTTTPFDMLVRNNTDRYHLLIDALARVSSKVVSFAEKKKLIAKYEDILKKHKLYIVKHGDDPDEIKWWKWSGAK